MGRIGRRCVGTHSGGVGVIEGQIMSLRSGPTDLLVAQGQAFLSS